MEDIWTSFRCRFFSEWGSVTSDTRKDNDIFWSTYWGKKEKIHEPIWQAKRLRWNSLRILAQVSWNHWWNLYRWSVPSITLVGSNGSKLRLAIVKSWRKACGWSIWQCSCCDGYSLQVSSFGFGGSFNDAPLLSYHKSILSCYVWPNSIWTALTCDTFYNPWSFFSLLFCHVRGLGWESSIPLLERFKEETNGVYSS